MENHNKCWEDFGEKYKNSPFFNIDFSIFTNKIETDKTSESKYNNEDMISTAKDEKMPHEFHELPRKSFPKLTYQSKCREILKQIRDFTYMVHDDEAMEQLQHQLQDSLELISSFATKDGGLAFQSKKEEGKFIKKSFSTLPTAKKSVKLSGRMGLGSEKWRE